jgi:hypothetical protein
MRKTLAVALLVGLLVATTAAPATAQSGIDDVITTDSPVAYYQLGGQPGASGDMHAFAAPYPIVSAVEFWFATTDAVTSSNVLRLVNPGGTSAAAAVMSSGHLVVGGLDVGSVSDGLVHHVFWNGASIYLDGTLKGSGVDTDITGTLIAGLEVGGSYGGRDPFIGSVESVAAFGSALSVTRIDAHYIAGAGAYYGSAVVQMGQCRAAGQALRNQLQIRAAQTERLRHKVGHQRHVIRHLRAELREARGH